jgi:hypothetical protein
MLTPYIVKKSEDLASIRDVLGRMELLENELALDFERKYELGETNLQKTRAGYSVSTPELEAETYTPPTTVVSDYYYRIDEFGKRYKIFVDINGHEIRSEPVEDLDF